MATAPMTVLEAAPVIVDCPRSNSASASRRLRPSGVRGARQQRSRAVVANVADTVYGDQGGDDGAISESVTTAADTALHGVAQAEQLADRGPGSGPDAALGGRLAGGGGQGCGAVCRIRIGITLADSEIEQDRPPERSGPHRLGSGSRCPGGAAIA